MGEKKKFFPKVKIMSASCFKSPPALLVLLAFALTAVTRVQAYSVDLRAHFAADYPRLEVGKNSHDRPHVIPAASRVKLVVTALSSPSEEQFDESVSSGVKDAAKEEEGASKANLIDFGQVTLLLYKNGENFYNISSIELSSQIKEGQSLSFHINFQAYSSLVTSKPLKIAVQIDGLPGVQSNRLAFIIRKENTLFSLCEYFFKLLTSLAFCVGFVYYSYYGGRWAMVYFGIIEMSYIRNSNRAEQSIKISDENAATYLNMSAAKTLNEKMLNRNKTSPKK